MRLLDVIWSINTSEENKMKPFYNPSAMVENYFMNVEATEFIENTS